LLLALLLVVLAAGAGGASGCLRRPAVAPSSVDTELAAIHAALTDLQHEYFRPIDAAAALGSAWDGAVTAAQPAGTRVSALARPQLAGDSSNARASFDRAFRSLAVAAAGSVDAPTLGHAAIAALASSVHENHTYFIDPDRWQHRADTVNSYAGIGVTTVERADGIYISEVFAGSPAAQAGLRAGDRFLKINDALVSDLQPGQLVNRLRGSPGSGVSVTVQRGVGTLQVAITRATISIVAFESRILDGGVGYLRLRSFPPAGSKLPNGQTVAQALDAALDGFDRAGVTSWVLDLRGNGGGYLDGMTEIASRFLPSGSPLLVSHTQGGDSVSRTGNGRHTPARPLAVLINGGSASASEILASALQESGRATVVGEKSAGVANAADLDSLPDGGGLSVTAVQSLTGLKRRPLDGQGVTPDSAVAANPDDVTTGRDSQIERAENLVRVAVAQAGP
jgi:carboxyl-terminal processing protease